MTKGIVITTYEGSPWLANCLISLRYTPYKVIIVRNNKTPELNTRYTYETGKVEKTESGFEVYKSFVCDEYPVARNGFELSGIAKGQEMFDEFIHLMDSTEIKDISMFDKLFAIEGNVFLTNGGYHYMGKFVSNTLGNLPIASNKEEAIQLELHWYHGPRTYFTPDLPVHTNNFEEKYGQNRMRLENDYMIKWKGTYR